MKQVATLQTNPAMNCMTLLHIMHLPWPEIGVTCFPCMVIASRCLFCRELGRVQRKKCRPSRVHEPPPMCREHALGGFVPLQATRVSHEVQLLGAGCLGCRDDTPMIVTATHDYSHALHSYYHWYYTFVHGLSFTVNLSWVLHVKYD